MKKTNYLFLFVAGMISFCNAYSQDKSVSGDDTAHCRVGLWDNYSKIFWEFSQHTNMKHTSYGTTVSYGTMVSFVPARLGGYASYKYEFGGTGLRTLGIVYRPFRINNMDLQLFAGPTWRRDNYENLYMGPEIGFRMSPNSVGNAGWFGWWSVTASYSYLWNEKSYFSIGFSVNISTIATLWYVFDTYVKKGN